MKLLLATVAAAVLLMTAGTVWLGTRAREDTVVVHPYEQGLAYDEQRRAVAAGHAHPAAAAPSAACDLGSGPCTLFLDDLVLTLEVSPRPPRALTDLAVESRLARGGLPVEGAELTLSFAMRGMRMGENVSRLASAGEGRYRGKAVLVRCTSGRRDWVVTAAVRLGGAERRADLDLSLGE